MKLLIISINYHPELTGIGKYTGEMAEWFSSQGHTVHVITAPPYYPWWRVLDGYKGSFYKREKINGVTIIRCPLWVPKKPNGLKRLIHLASFAISSLWVAIWQGITLRPDWIFVVEPPLLAAPATLLSSRVCGASTCLHIQDFEVDAAFDLGILRFNLGKRLITHFEQFLMRHFDKVTTISGRMLDRLRSKGLASGVCGLLPNWAELNLIYPLKKESPFRAQWGFKKKDLIVLYSGNMGAKQGLEIITDAAAKLTNYPFIHFIICGDGFGKAILRTRAENLPNVHFKPLQPLNKLNDLLNLADIHLLPQRNDAADLVLPSKLTNILASGRPTVASVNPNTEIYQILQEKGICVPPGEAEEMASAILTLAENSKLRYSMGHAARKYAERHLAKKKILKDFERQLL